MNKKLIKSKGIYLQFKYFLATESANSWFFILIISFISLYLVVKSIAAYFLSITSLELNSIIASKYVKYS